MKTHKIAVVISFLLGGAAGALVYAQFGANHSAPVGATQQQMGSVSFTATTRGELTQASPVNLNDGSRYAAFSLIPEQSGLLRIEQSGPLSGYMTVLDSEYERLQSASYSNDVYLWFDEESDDAMTLIVSGYDATSYGPFRLRTEWLTVQNEGELNDGETINGFLNHGPNQYSVLIEEAGMYQIDMRSSAFDSYLRLRGQGVEHTDDDGGEGLDARLVVILQPGEYQLFATTPYGDGRDMQGQYSLEMQNLGDMGDYQQGGSVEVGQSIRGFLTDSFFDYQFTLEEERQVRIDLTSDAFDTYLELEGPSVSLFDDDGGAGTNSMLNERLPAGEYRIRVRPYSTGHGLFELSVR